jgi:thiamine transport system permease protein
VTLGLGFFTAFAGIAGSQRWAGLLIPLAHVLISLPFVLRVVQPALQSIPANIKFAAQSLGARPLEVWRFVELPIIWRALMTAAVYAFTISLGEFGATSFLSRPDMPTMPIAIFRYLNLPGSSNYGQAMAMAVIILIVCIISMAFLDRLQYNPNFGTS